MIASYLLPLPRKERQSREKSTQRKENRGKDKNWEKQKEDRWSSWRPALRSVLGTKSKSAIYSHSLHTTYLFTEKRNEFVLQNINVSEYTTKYLQL